MGGVNTGLFGHRFNKYIFDKKDTLLFYINKLKCSYKSNLNDNRVDKILKGNIITNIDKEFILHLAIFYFLLIYTSACFATQQNSDNDKNYLLVPVSIAIGKKMVSRYLNILKRKSEENINNKSLSYTLWFIKWKFLNP